jgi:hypothetical protein
MQAPGQALGPEPGREGGEHIMFILTTAAMSGGPLVPVVMVKASAGGGRGR